MKSGQIFWGAFFVFMGILILLTRMEVIDLTWYRLWKWWPAVLILIGISIVIKNSIAKPVINAFSGVLTALVIFATFNSIFGYVDNEWDCHYERDWNRKSSRYNFNHGSDYSVDFPSEIEKAKLEFYTGAGNFNISGVTSNLIDVDARGKYAEYYYNMTHTNNKARIKIDWENDHLELNDKNNDHHLDIMLNDRPEWEFFIGIGAAECNFDLSDFEVSYIELKTGAASVDLYLGNKSERTDIDINMGAAAVNIKIPRDTGCKVTSNTFLFGKTLSGFYEKGGVHYTDNFDDAENIVDIHVSGALGSIDIVRY